MKVKLKVPARNHTLPMWSGGQLAAYLLQHPSHSSRPEHVKAYVETFGKEPPATADAWDVRTAVFYEQSLRILHAESKTPDETFLQRHKVALAFGTRLPGAKFSKTPKSSEHDPAVNSHRSLQSVHHTCGHKEVRAVDSKELKVMEKAPCARCAPRMAFVDMMRIEEHVVNNQPKEEKSMATKSAKKGTAKEGPIGKGIKGKTSGLNKSAFIVSLLKGNEKAKEGDAVLQKKLDGEYPGTATYPISGMRAKLNRGGFGDVGFESKPYGEPVKAKKVAPAAGKASVLAKGEAVQKAGGKKTAPAAEATPAAVPAKKVRLRAPVQEA